MYKNTIYLVCSKYCIKLLAKHRILQFKTAFWWYVKQCKIFPAPLILLAIAFVWMVVGGGYKKTEDDLYSVATPHHHHHHQPPGTTHTTIWYIYIHYIDNGKLNMQYEKVYTLICIMEKSLNIIMEFCHGKCADTLIWEWWFYKHCLFCGMYKHNFSISQNMSYCIIKINPISNKYCLVLVTLLL